MYGLRSSPKAWQERLAKVMKISARLVETVKASFQPHGATATRAGHIELLRVWKKNANVHIAFWLKHRMDM